MQWLNILIANFVLYLCFQQLILREILNVCYADATSFVGCLYY